MSLHRIGAVFFLFAGMLMITAQDVQALSLEHQINPGFQQVIVKPNKSVFLDYTFTNLKDPGIYSFQIYALTNPNKDGDFQLAPLDRLPVSAILLSKGTILNQPVLLEEKDAFPFRLKIDIPRGTPPGEYAFAIVGRNKPQPAQEGAISAQVSNGIGSTLLLTVTEDGIDIPDTGVADLTIGNPVTFQLFGATINLFDSNQPIPVTLTLTNQGKYSLIPRGSITVKGSFRADETHVLLPQYLYAQSQRYASLVKSGDERCRSVTPDICEQGKTMILPGYFFGVFEVAAAIELGEDESTAYHTEHFVVMPYKAIGVIILILVGFGAYLTRHWIEHSNSRPEIVHRKKISRS